MNGSLSGPRFTALHTEIVERVELGDIPSVSIGVIQRERILWRESIGLADKETNRLASLNTPYGLASLGKSITATAVMVLVERMEINLNAPIAQYIGAESLNIYEGELDQVTVRRILNMTAGIPPGHMIFNSPDHIWAYSINNIISNRGLVVFPPGECYLFSDFAYALLEKLISEVSGTPFHEFLKMEVFEPLDMRNSFVSPEKDIEMTAPTAHYHLDGNRIPPLYMLPRNSLAIYASLNDLLKFAHFQMGKGEFIRRPFFDRTLEKMHDLHGEAPGSLMTLGWVRSKLDDQRFWLLSNGRAGGMQATLSMIPAEELAVICLINATGQASDDLAFRITDLLLPGFLDRTLQIIKKYESWADRPYKPTAELLGTWSGNIQIAEAHIPIEMYFQKEGMILTAIGGGPKTPLSEVGYRSNLLSGNITGILPMEEAQYEPHPVTLSIRLKDGRLSGFVTSKINNERGNFSLAGYLSLSKGIVNQEIKDDVNLSLASRSEDEQDVVEGQFVRTNSKS